MKLGDTTAAPAIAATSTFVVVGLAAIHFGWIGPQPAPEQAARAPQVAAADPVQVSENAVENVSGLSGEATVVTVPPSFDVVRIEPDGTAVIAGRAAPQASVSVLLDGAALGASEADSDGRFVAFLDLGVSDSARVMSLRSPGPEGDLISEEEIIVTPSVPSTDTADAAPSAPAAAAVTEARAIAPDQDQDEADLDEAEPVAGSGETGTARLPGDDAPAIDSAEAMAPTVLLADRDGVRVLQMPGEKSDTTLELQTISYDEAGAVRMSGHASPGHVLQIYLDDAPLMTAPVAEDGSWQAALPEIDAGVYRLRVDLVDGAGDVISRVATPFERVMPLPTEEGAAPTGRVRQITVQPGHTLWAIARDSYGEGLLYVQVYAANNDLIRDPDLIYPGQVISIPELPAQPSER